MPRRAALAFSSLASLTAMIGGCFSTSNTDTLGSAQTLVTVDPATFRGDLACGPYPGAIQAYVATLTDVTAGFEVASSGPTPCNLPVSFAFVVPGHAYVAAIDLYDRADLVPRGGPGSGSPTMVDPGTGDVVAPAFRTGCGAMDAAADATESIDAGADADATESTDAGADADADVDAAPPRDTAHAPTFAELYRDVTMRGCEPIMSSAPASVSLDLSAALGQLTCSANASVDAGATDVVDHLVVTPSDPSLGAKTATCGEGITYEGLAASRTYLFDVAAFPPGSSSAGWSAECHVFTTAGATLPASCTPLAALGAHDP